MTSITHRMARQAIRGRYFPDRATVRLQTGGHRNDYGEWVPGAADTRVELVASTPLSGEERRELPEGARETDARKFWLTDDSEVQPIRTGANPTEGDLIVWEGTVYRAIRAEQWPGYWQVIAVRGEQDN